MKNLDISGFLPLLKQRGRSSNYEIQGLKQRLKIKKIGHCGTLDPIAEGVLPVLVNKATRTMRFFLEYPKTYLATIQFGISTDTLDITGKIISESTPEIDKGVFTKVVERYIGTIVQNTPNFSARKFMGRNLYDYARKGIEPPPKTKEVQIYEINLHKFELPYVEIEVRCGSGTYIRQLINDICTVLGVDGTMYALTRTSYGIFNIDNSKRVQNIDINDILPIDVVFEDYGRFFIKSSIFKIARNGSPVNTDDCKNILREDAARFLGFFENELLGIYRKEGQLFVAEVILSE